MMADRSKYGEHIFEAFVQLDIYLTGEREHHVRGAWNREHAKRFEGNDAEMLEDVVFGDVFNLAGDGGWTRINIYGWSEDAQRFGDVILLDTTPGKTARSTERWDDRRAVELRTRIKTAVQALNQMLG